MTTDQKGNFNELFVRDSLLSKGPAEIHSDLVDGSGNPIYDSAAGQIAEAKLPAMDFVPLDGADAMTGTLDAPAVHINGATLSKQPWDTLLTIDSGLDLTDKGMFCSEVAIDATDDGPPEVVVHGHNGNGGVAFSSTEIRENDSGEVEVVDSAGNVTVIS